MTMDQPDYEPLTRREVVNLLNEAIAVKDHSANDPHVASKIARIQVRLDRAIPGMTTPRPIDGPVSGCAEPVGSCICCVDHQPHNAFPQGV